MEDSYTSPYWLVGLTFPFNPRHPQWLRHGSCQWPVASIVAVYQGDSIYLILFSVVTTFTVYPMNSLHSARVPSVSFNQCLGRAWQGPCFCGCTRANEELLAEANYTNCTAAIT